MVVAARRTQLERRESTRAALLTAALDCLVEAGMAGFTTTEVCRRAGLSQGALFKHFPSKSELLAGTTAHLFATLRADFEAAFLALPIKRRSARYGLDLLWDQMFDPRLGAAFELYTIARTDHELRDALGPVVRQHLQRTHRLATSLLGGEDPRKLRDVVDLVTLAIQGLVIDQMALPDPEHRKRLRRFLDQLAPVLFPG
jgi:AcrR family transcriptional regulator